MLNITLIVLIIITLVILLYRYFGKSKKFSCYNLKEDKYSLNTMTKFIKEVFNDILRTNFYDMNMTKEEFNKRIQNRNQLRKALKNCTFGDLNAKNYVKAFIKDILIKSYQINETNINKIINFDNYKELLTQDRFDIMLYVYKQKHGYKALECLLLENNLDALKDTSDGKKYVIETSDINRIFNKKIKMTLKFDDKLNIVVQRIYQRYKGYGVVDEIRDMKIDGVSGGVSGIPPSFAEKIDFNVRTSDIKVTKFNYDSIWIFFKGKTIHLSFLSFKSHKELIRVCKNMYRYNNPGQLSESNGYMINEMKDGSRVVVARPPFAESWVFFVRKFDSLKNQHMEELITDKNSELPIKFVEWAIKGCLVTAVTGNQGTGKTTLLMSIIKFINPTYTLRIQEMAFELHLRRIYPDRNILTLRETKTISGQEGLDLQKKTDGTVNILGEVATAPVAAYMLQMSQVASLFTLFTHHAKTAENLVVALRNNLLQTGAFTNESVAEIQVAKVININIHLNKDINGHRYIEKITEIIPQFSEKCYPQEYKKANNHEEKIDLFLNTINEYFQRMTDKKKFDTREIIVWENGEYKPKNPMTSYTYNKICRHIAVDEKSVLDEFLINIWGKTYE
ncbi:ATPase, T2SS/T4P/T4SS family [Clostridiaceae bacterium M8S5]|nr:ATPase, T2SS/T4P/T4SS family [Clostridiaceae bacterium M8S5]